MKDGTILAAVLIGTLCSFAVSKWTAQKESVIESRGTVTHPAGADFRETATAPPWGWVTVMNPTGVANGDGEFSLMDFCSIEPGGTLTLRGSSRIAYIVEYTTPNHEVVYGTSCPSGTVFAFRHERFKTMSMSWKPENEMPEAGQQVLRAELP